MRKGLSRRAVLGGALASATSLRLRAHADEAPVVHEVTIKRFTYEPKHIQARVGDIIRWTNLDIAPHTASADDLSWDTGELKKGESAEMVINDRMELTYFCVFHPHMKGKIEIV
ncbi:Plastocyanin precursor [Ruegeria denitrificans]|uniref:Plastocyanin n=1 Tax=Ruegeria denitrificans TaxID=1715692 RepID=A0A0P1IIV2_9RHOB|nr:cupredoxin domain-containing protein [Ruegeria denitrificans]CUK04414.1 Plastocyanin precursor [Ruegeria denitrificans]